MDKRVSIVWDWNGTIIDDLEYCVSVLNYFLSARAMKTIDVEFYRNNFTFPVIDFYKSMGFDLQNEDMIAISKDWNDLYYSNVNCCQLRSGVREIIYYFKEKDFSQYIVSASEHNMLNRIVDSFNLRPYFQNVMGIDNHQARGKLHLAEKIKEELRPTEMYVIGDSIHDYELSCYLGAQSILVNNGHQSEEKLRTCSKAIIVNDFAEIKALFNSN
ncbi:MAG: HAD family hydrolase [Deltaproteobacteria bacterium]|nr:HAD family hydrolase [Deltaproteobacteria bacterium]